MSAKRVKETTQAVQRSIDILEAVALVDGSIGVSALARRIGLSKATTYRLCQTLVDRHFLDQNVQTGEYRLGARLLTMSARLLGGINLAQMARPILEQMAATCRQNAFVGLLEDMQAMLICEEVRFDNPVQPRPLLGARFRILDAPGGLLCLASLDEKCLETVLRNTLRQNSKAEPGLSRDLADTIHRLRGSAYSVQEGIPYGNTIVICSMVRDRREKAMGVVGYGCPQLLNEEIDCEQLGNACCQAAKLLSAMLSG